MDTNYKTIIKLCKDIGCCDACCIRYIGLKSPEAYENANKFVSKYLDQDIPIIPTNQTTDKEESKDICDDGGMIDNNGCGETPAKKMKKNDVCISCIGILQEQTWPESINMVKEMLEQKKYDCKRFACGLSAPLSVIIHERVVTLQLEKAVKAYDRHSVTPLKEAWKWCFGCQLASDINMELESGAVAPLLVTLHIQYTEDKQELEALRLLHPSPFPRGAPSRRAVERAAAALAAGEGVVTEGRAAHCASVESLHTPVYLGGRYIKTSRALPQTPWLVDGRRIMESSVQEIIFQPIARVVGIPDDKMNERLKFMSAGREDVDVRCLGDGRPFAVEITDPRRELTEEELQTICEEISKSGSVRVHKLVHVSRERLAELKKGEETKRKTYELLCIKLGHTPDDIAAGAPCVRVTPADVLRLSGAGAVCQRTPLRVLHRRPLAARDRRLAVSARTVPEHPQLFVLTVDADAGTYIKEWAHGEAGRSAPSAASRLRAPVDILALDLLQVHLQWP